MTASRDYIGRFAPSPTGPLHAGSLVAALASWLDARAHGGRWLVRIEDVDRPRCVPGADAEILRQLAALGLQSDAPPAWQSTRTPRHAAALDRLAAAGLAYGCSCSRQDVARANAALGRGPERHGETVYPGSCRPERGGPRPGRPLAWRLRVPDGDAACIAWTDRRLGVQAQPVDRAVGDFVLRRADGLWAYQLAVVVDDADDRITDVVRGEDLADNTPRQVLLQGALGLPTPRYLHVALVRDAAGEKLSKQQGAPPIDTTAPLATLAVAGRHLGMDVAAATPADWLARAADAWRARWGV